MFSRFYFSTELSLVVLCITFTLAVIVVSIFYSRKSSKKKQIPGPPRTHPEKGNLDELSKAGGHFYYVKELHAKYGKIVGFWWGKNYIVSVACPHLWKDILHLFDRPRYVFESFEPLFGSKTIQWKNGPEGRRLRQVVERRFTHEAVKDYYVYFLESMNKKAEQWMSVPQGQAIPVMENMMHIAFRSIGRAGMGRNFIDEKDITKFEDAYEVAWRELEGQLADPPPETGSEREKKFKEAIDCMRMFALKSIKERRANPDHEDKLIIDSLLEYKDIDIDELEDGVLAFLIGGFHTTGMLMTWTIYFLAMHQDIQEKVYQELIDVLGDEEIQPDIAGELRYCRQVLDETLRCAIIAPWGARVSDHDVKIGEYIVKKQTAIFTPFGVVLQDPEIFPDPERFDPERFSQENSKTRPPLAYQPFGFAGKRKCPAWRFSLSEGLVFLSVFCRKFKIGSVLEENIEMLHGFVTLPETEFHVTIENR